MKKILRSSLSIAAITLAGRSIGYLEKMVLSYYFGTSYKTDIYILILSIITSVFIFFRELVEPGFLKVFLQALGKGDRKGAWTFFNRAGAGIFILAATLAVLVFFNARAIIGVCAPGFKGMEKDLAARLLKYAYPATIFLSLTALTGITLNAHKQFVLPVLGELAFKLSILAAIWLLFPGIGIYAVAAGVTVGAGIKLAIHIAGLFRKYARGGGKTDKAYMGEAWKLTWPLLIGVGFSQMSVFVDNYFASYMKEGSIAALGYAKKVCELPVLLFPYMLSVVIFPYFSELAVAGDTQKLSGMLRQALVWIVTIFLPLSVFFYCFSYELAELIFQRGAFGSYSTELTAYPLRLYACGMVFFAVETIIVVFYFSHSNTKVPILVGVLCVIENIVLTWLLIKPAGYAGIAIGLVVSKATKVVVLLGYSRIKKMADLQFLSLFKPVIASLLLIPLLFLYKRAIAGHGGHGALGKLFSLSTAFLFCGLVYTGFFLLIKGRKELKLFAPR